MADRASPSQCPTSPSESSPFDQSPQKNPVAKTFVELDGATRVLADLFDIDTALVRVIHLIALFSQLLPRFVLQLVSIHPVTAGEGKDDTDTLGRRFGDRRIVGLVGFMSE